MGWLATGHSGATLDVISILNVTLTKPHHHVLPHVPRATFTLQPYSNVATRRGQPDLVSGSLRPLFTPLLHNCVTNWEIKNITRLRRPERATFCKRKWTVDIYSLELLVALKWPQWPRGHAVPFNPHCCGDSRANYTHYVSAAIKGVITVGWQSSVRLLLIY